MNIYENFLWKDLNHENQKNLSKNSTLDEKANEVKTHLIILKYKGINTKMKNRIDFWNYYQIFS